ncbi:MAG TPA: DoxX family protein [Bryobacteraceae bacterium]|nr:DoxX family protein [Bryobacteraceae bacterium]
MSAPQNPPKWTPYLLSVLRIAIGLIFFQHGAEKIWGFAGGRIDHNFATMHGFAGPLEVIGGALITLGLFTRTTAFLLCGEMAVAYFTRWAPRGFWPITNGGEEAVIFCFVFLWLVTSGAGPWSVDFLLQRKTRFAPANVSVAGSGEPLIVKNG